MAFPKFPVEVSPVDFTNLIRCPNLSLPTELLTKRLISLQLPTKSGTFMLLFYELPEFWESPLAQGFQSLRR